MSLTKFSEQAQALLEYDTPTSPTKHLVVALCHDAVVRQDRKGRLAVLLNSEDFGALGKLTLLHSNYTSVSVISQWCRPCFLG